jgi:hypothetical protein
METGGGRCREAATRRIPRLGDAAAGGDRRDRAGLLGHVIIKREITFGQEAALTPLVNPAGELTLKGSFRYQACDVCYVPQVVPLEWHFHFEGLDRARVPADLQRKRP